MPVPKVPVPAGRKRIFDSVFPSSKLKDLAPTPAATPVLGSTEPGQAFGGHCDQSYSSAEPPVSSEPIPEQVVWDRHWHTATAFLTFPDKALIADEDVEDLKLLRSRFSKPKRDVSEALAYLASPKLRHMKNFGPEFNLNAWYINEVRRHFLAFVKPVLTQLLQTDPSGTNALGPFCQTLHRAQSMYYFPVHEHLLLMVHSSQRGNVSKGFKKDVHAMIAFSLPQDKVNRLICRMLDGSATVILGIDSGKDNSFVEDSYTQETGDVAQTRAEFLVTLQQLQAAGLGGSRAQKIFATVMDKMLEDYVNKTCAGEWALASNTVERLKSWVENVFAILVAQVLDVLKSPAKTSKEQNLLEVGINDVEKWQGMAMARLGAMRTTELFDVVVDWDASSGAVQDLEQYTTNPATRTWLTTHFVCVLTSRLLQPGASTVEILQIYISIIRAFKILDPKGVLLDRVARPVRRYLRDRDDTVKAIVGGLLSDSVDGDEGEPLTASGEILTELAAELIADKGTPSADDGELDWGDMNWVPDPIDAAPDYKKSKDSDVIGSLISLFESKDVFVKELQNSLAERLLKKQFDFDQEIAVLEHLKMRFGHSALQACEVMLRDVLDSRRLDNVIRHDQGMAMEVDHATATVVDVELQLHAKILSRLFWPTLQEQSFKVPQQIAALQTRYETGFEALKQSRKLTWLNALGRVSVELDLDDRLFKDEVLPWQAAIIHAFQSNESDNGTPVSRTIDSLAEELEMSPVLVRSGCIFWVSKRILAESFPGTYRVLEILPDGDSADAEANPSDSATAAAAEAASQAAAQAAKDSEMEKMQLYWQFIVAMLTNQGAMPLLRIAMMLNIVVPGGFPFSNEDLKEFLGKMVQEGKVEVGAGGNYRVVT